MSAYTKYWCTRCGGERQSSNPRADIDGTVCPMCTQDGKARETAHPASSRG